MLGLLVLVGLLCVCNGDYNGVMVGSFPPGAAHGVKGTVYAVDPQTLRVVDFEYDGLGPDAYFWMSKTGAPGPIGDILPFNRLNKTAILPAFMRRTLTLELPSGYLVKDLAWVSVWCRRAKSDFGHVTFAGNFAPPEPLSLGTFPGSSSNGIKADVVTVKNHKQIMLTNFMYDGQCSEAYFMGGKGAINYANGMIIPNELGSKDTLGKYEGQDLMLMLPEDKEVDDIDWFSVYCKATDKNLGHVAVTHNQMVPVYVEMGYYGKELGVLDNKNHGVVGAIYIVDSKKIMLRGFSYDGACPDAYFYIGKKGEHGTTPSGNGIIINNEMGTKDKLKKYDNANILLELPSDLEMTQVAWFSVWCKRDITDFGSIVFPSSVDVPAKMNLGVFSQLAHDLKSGDVTILDKRRVMIENLEYDGRGPDAFFLVGTGPTVSHKGAVKIPDETGSTDKLKKYTGKTITLTLPEAITVDDIDWISMYCITATQDFGNVKLPKSMYSVPPYLNPGMRYYGQEIGTLSTNSHDVKGTMFVVDNNRIMLRGFSYSGAGPDALFYIGKKGEHGSTPNGNGIIINNEMGTKETLKKYDNANIVLRLPDDLVMPQVAWFSVWCKNVSADFGSLVFPPNVVVPAEVGLGMFSQLNHGVKSGKVTIIDKRRLKIEDLYYDGRGPDAFFLTGTGLNIGSVGATKIPDETGSTSKLKKYTGQTITLALPWPTTVDDIDWISMFCIAANQDFGNVKLPQASYSVPPYIPPPQSAPLTNCETMRTDKFNVAWEVNEEQSKIEFEFTGALDGDSGYMTFGLSGQTTRSSMLGADPWVVYLTDGRAYVEDYTINSYSLCAQTTGVCPDTKFNGGKSDLEMISSRVQDGITTVRFSRPLVGTDSTLDKTIVTDKDMYIVWAMGKVNGIQMVTKHTHRLSGDASVNFGRSGQLNCNPVVGIPPKKVEPWKPNKISGMDIKVFNAKLGPTGGKKGYEGITGQVSWGIAWYINGLLIPEITVKRGETYTFKVEGGNNATNQAKHHPFYITDDTLGGYATKNPDEKKMVKIFAGANATAGAEGRYCEYSPKPDTNPESFDTFEEYMKKLDIRCESGTDVGQFSWTPDKNTPDLVYYQCYTHNYLGWKIHVVDEFSETAGASQLFQSCIVLLSVLLLSCLS